MKNKFINKNSTKRKKKTLEHEYKWNLESRKQDKGEKQ